MSDRYSREWALSVLRCVRHLKGAATHLGAVVSYHGLSHAYDSVVTDEHGPSLMRSVVSKRALNDDEACPVHTDRACLMTTQAGSPELDVPAHNCEGPWPSLLLFSPLRAHRVVNRAIGQPELGAGHFERAEEMQVGYLQHRRPLQEREEMRFLRNDSGLVRCM